MNELQQNILQSANEQKQGRMNFSERTETGTNETFSNQPDSPIIEKRSFTILLALESSDSASAFAHSATYLLSLYRPISLLALCSSFAFEECF
ncbi:hypothetical protein VNO77_39282 [Canavalia gladiata]|uniref:Uncharacterized protein n=1 Tax=Canavalia gladiata TaxID=3824 RepID=A0AAN9PZM3_CANGL